MSNTSPDFSIVKFTLLGVTYLFSGSSGKVQIVFGKEVLPIKADLEEALKGAITQHVPASDQILEALASIGVPVDAMPVITYTDHQPQDTLPEGAIS